MAGSRWIDRYRKREDSAWIRPGDRSTPQVPILKLQVPQPRWGATIAPTLPGRVANHLENEVVAVHAARAADILPVPKIALRSTEATGAIVAEASSCNAAPRGCHASTPGGAPATSSILEIAI